MPNESLKLDFSPLDRATAAEITTWRYPPPYDIYNFVEHSETLIDALSNPENAYYQMRYEHGDLVGCCCFGSEAQVPGGDYSLPALDVGIAIRPELTGCGLGRYHFGALLDFASQQFAPPAFRLSVAVFNSRARRLYGSMGFQKIQRFTVPFTKREFVVMLRDAA